MKKINLIVIFLISFFFSFSQNEINFDCYTIAVGSKASDTHSVLIGHNEDDGGDVMVNIHKVPQIEYDTGSVYKLITGEIIQQVDMSFPLLWIETTTHNFGDFFMNGNGVSICSNACQSKEDTAKGILTYDFRKIIAERAYSARNGVEIAAELLSLYGYNSSGRTYCIADAWEVWIMAVVQGNHWVAQRVPDNEVAIIPNYYTIGEINLNDSINFMASPDIIDYAIERGWYDSTSGKPFNFRLAYSSKKVLTSTGNILRHWAGINLLSVKQYELNFILPFSFVPKGKISMSDLKKVLSNHYENTDFESNYNSAKTPHDGKQRTICHLSTKYSVIVELHNTYPENNQNVVWFAPTNPCINPYVPIAFTIDSIPDPYSIYSYSDYYDNHFNDSLCNVNNNKNAAYAMFMLNIKNINTDYWKLYSKSWDKKQIFEDIYKDKFKGYQKNEVSYDLLEGLYKSMKK